MDKPLLSLGIIVKNEEKTLPTLLKSIVPYVDQVVVTDTGSTDKTKQICERYCGKKLKWTEFEWVNDFGKARQFNLDNCDGEWFVWADADDEVINAHFLKKAVEYAIEYEINAIMFPYHYVIDENDKTRCLQVRERLIQNNGTYRWAARLHEGLMPQNPAARAVKLETISWAHRATPERVEASKLRNVDILESALEEEITNEKVDPRTLYNLGNAYFTIEDFRKALGCYAKYIPLSGWDQEKYLAHHRSSLALKNLGDLKGAMGAAFAAIELKPEYPDAYIDLGKIYFDMQDYDKAMYWFEQALEKPFPELLPVVNPMDYQENLWFLLGNTHIQRGDYKNALPFLLKFQEAVPDYPDVDNMIEVLHQAQKEAADVKALAYVSDLMPPEFWELVPRKYLEFPEVLVKKNKVVTKPTSTGRDIAIYCGRCLVKWDPDSVTSGGIGGSEEAVINLAKGLQEKGWNVTIYGRPNTEKTFDGVVYKHYTAFNPRDFWDIFICWRMPSVFSADINAKKKYLWLHDTTPQDSLGLHVQKQVEKIIVLSDYHRSLYPALPDSLFLMSGNGIVPEQFEQEIEKNPFKCIYTSAPDRGLEALLTLWPKIQEQVPKAELHWFYGWETFDELHEGNIEKQQYKAKIEKLLDQPGVFGRGRVNHEEIAKEMLDSQLWVYPTEFTEIYCISSVKAQAANALPVTTNVAALDQMVQFGTKFDTKTIYSDEKMQETFIETVVNYLKNPDVVELERDGMQQWAVSTHSWQNIVDQWDNEFDLVLKNIPMGKYKVLGGEWGEGYAPGDIIDLDELAAAGRLKEGHLEPADGSAPAPVEDEAAPVEEAPVEATESKGKECCGSMGPRHKKDCEAPAIESTEAEAAV